MATRIPDGPTGRGRGCSTCTRTGGSRLIEDMKLGPDGVNWDELSEEEVVQLFSGETKFRHISNGKITHLCAGKGTWAFRVFTSSSPLGVAFLHIRPPKKLDETMGDGANDIRFSGVSMLEGYNYAKAGSRAPRVWRRNVPGWDEIAINFCVMIN